MLKKHPKGLMILFMTEIWERFGFYIMSSIFVLYMQHDLNYDGTTRGILYAVFLGASYMFPIAGGFLGDRLYGQIRTIRYGAYLMAIGYIFFGLSSIDAQYLFYIGLAFVTFGTGIFKVNMSVLLGSMYKGNESRKDAGFNIYYMGVNIGATIGPFAANIIGYLTDNYNISFYAAAIGMVLSILIFEFNRKKLEEFDSKLKQIDEENNNIEIKTVSPDPQMDKAEFKDRIVTLIMLFLVASLFWVPFYQNGIGLTYFVDRSTVQHELLRPELYLAFNAIFIVILTPIMLAIFGKMREKGKEPATPNKIFIGLILMGSSMLIMVWASLEGGNLNQNIMSPLWVIMTYLIVTLAEIMISPLGQSYVTKVAPPKVQGLMMGGWFGATALGGMTSGLIAAFYDTMSHHMYFLALAVLTFFAAAMILLFMKKLKKYGN
ncbi:peptide MFS transporter [Bacteroidota bacterium]